MGRWTVDVQYSTDSYMQLQTVPETYRQFQTVIERLQRVIGVVGVIDDTDSTESTRAVHYTHTVEYTHEVHTVTRVHRNIDFGQYSESTQTMAGNGISTHLDGPSTHPLQRLAK